MLIYIIGPYSGETKAETFRNVVEAIRAAEWIWERGHTPIIPHLTWLVEQISDRFDRKSFLQWSSEMLISAHAVFLIREDESEGVQAELQIAIDIGLPIFTNPSQIPIDSKALVKRQELLMPEYVEFVIKRKIIETGRFLRKGEDK